MQTNNTRLLTIGAIMFGMALTRLLPHPVNFTPMAAIAVFGGAQLMHNRHRFGLMLLAALLSDLLVNSLLYNYNDLSYFLEPGTLGIYGCYMFFVWMGTTLKKVNVVGVGSRSILASAVFFIVSNLTLWAGSTFYTQDLTGLMACYIAAIPFIQNSFAGDLIYSGILFGGFALLQKRIPVLAIQR